MSMFYVVTFERGDTLTLTGLRRMTLVEARSVLRLAGSIPKRGRIVDTRTGAVVQD